MVVLSGCYIVLEPFPRVTDWLDFAQVYCANFGEQLKLTLASLKLNITM